MGHTIQAQTLGPAHTQPSARLRSVQDLKKPMYLLFLSALARHRLPTSAASRSTALEAAAALSPAPSAQEAGAARPPSLAQKAAAARTTGALSPDIPLRFPFLLPTQNPPTFRVPPPW
jgi:hypothetical protein